MREYRVSIAASEHPGARCVEQLLLQPPKSLTVSFRALSFSVISVSAVRDAPGAAGDLVASMAQTPPCMMDSWIQEMLRLHTVFVGDEFMGKVALPATLLWTDISGVEARHATIRRLTLLHGAVGIMSFLQARNRRSTQRLGRRRGQSRPSCGLRSWRSAPGPTPRRRPLCRCVPHLRLSGAGFSCMVRVCALAIYARGAFRTCHGRVHRAHSAVHRAWRVAKNAFPVPLSSSLASLAWASFV